MAHSERHEDLAAALALGALVGPERAELEAHLQEGCLRCEEPFTGGPDMLGG